MEAQSQKQREAKILFRRMGIAFAVYGEAAGTERLIPFDIVPRVFGADEWEHLKQGLLQRVHALNAFLHDIYHEQHIIQAGIIPAHQILVNKLYRLEMQGIDLPNKVYAHIAGIDFFKSAKPNTASRLSIALSKPKLLRHASSSPFSIILDTAAGLSISADGTTTAENGMARSFQAVYLPGKHPCNPI